jgi:hypothetical protein
LRLRSDLKVKVVVAALVALASVPVAQPAGAQEWPQRAVQMMALFASGAQ